MPPNLYNDKYRSRSEVCEVRYFDPNNAPLINQSFTGVPIVYDHKWTFRMATFGYDISAWITDAFCVELLMKPTGEANKRNTSKFGFHLAADSMAHACLHKKNWNQLKRKYIWQLSRTHSLTHLAFNRTKLSAKQDVSWKKILFPSLGCRSENKISSRNAMDPLSSDPSISLCW